MFIQYIMWGGWVIFVIIAVSVIGMAVFVERVIYIYKVRKNAKIIKERVFEKLKSQRIDEAISVCENHPGAAATIIKRALELADKPEETIEKAMEESAKFEVVRLNKYLPILATIVSLSTLLGLLGTVLGIITAGLAMSGDAMSNPGNLIQGIAQALVNTVAGLIVAIPTLISYNFLVSYIDNLLSDIEEIASEVSRSVRRKDELKRW